MPIAKPSKAAKGTPPEPPPEPKSILVDKLDVLQSQCEKEVAVEIKFRNKDYRVKLRHLTPAEDAKLRNIIDIVTPPMVRGKTMEDDRPDFSAPEFVKKKNDAETQARALAIYWCVPMFKDAMPGLTNATEIETFVQSKLDDQLLGVIYRAIREGGVTLAELVNFP